jgi:hypothetical protein
MNTPKIITWLNAFIANHEAMHPAFHWPEPDSDGARRMWNRWFDAFRDDKVTKEEAQAASVIMGEEPCRIEDHPGLVVDIVQGLRKQPPPEMKAQAAVIEPVDEEARMDEAAALLDAFSDVGWEFRWHRDPEITTEDEAYAEGLRTTVDGWYLQAHRRAEHPAAPRPSKDLSDRLRVARWEIYFLMGRPLPTAAEIRDRLRSFDDMKRQLVSLARANEE